VLPTAGKIISVKIAKIQGTKQTRKLLGQMSALHFFATDFLKDWILSLMSKGLFAISYFIAI